MTTKNLRWLSSEYGTYTLKINNYTLIVTQNLVQCYWMVSDDSINEVVASSYRSRLKYTTKEFDKAKEDCLKAYQKIVLLK